MSASPDLAFQKLLGAQIAAAVPTVVVDAAPVFGRALPYIQIGESDIEEWEVGHSITSMVHVWSEAEGPHIVKQHQHSIREALHGTTFTQDGWQLTCIREQYADVIQDPDKKTWHGVQRFRALAQYVS